MEPSWVHSPFFNQITGMDRFRILNFSFFRKVLECIRHIVRETPYLTIKPTNVSCSKMYDYSQSLERNKALNSLTCVQARFCHQMGFCQTFVFRAFGMLVLRINGCISRLRAFRPQERRWRPREQGRGCRRQRGMPRSFFCVGLKDHPPVAERG